MNEDTSAEVTPRNPSGDRAAHDGDYRLSEPSARAGTGAGEEGLVGAGADTTVSESPSSPGGGAGAAVGDEGEGDYVLSGPSAPAGSEGGRDAGDASGAAAAAPAPSGSAVASATERPKPLHDPDPYSTPPYGEPGPWAPAPPVQHPAATPAQGTAAPAAGPVGEPHGTATPAPGPVASPPPGAGLPAPRPVAAEVPAPHPTAADAQAAYLSAPAPLDQPHGTETPAPGSTGAPASHAAAPAPLDQPHGTEAPVSAAPQAPHPYAPVPSGPPPVQSGPPVTSPPSALLPTSDAFPQDAPAPDAPADPWQRYDPWAATPIPGAPLQQTGAAVLSQEQRRRRGRKALVGGAVVLALVAGGIGGAVGAYVERNGGVGAVELPQAAAEPAGRAPDSVAGIAARALPSVVTLHVSGSKEQGTGTGFVLDTRGHILTNNHVVEPAGDDGQITVVFNGGETARAEVVGHDSGYDLAVVKVTGVKGLKPLPLGNSDSVQVGDPVVAIGAPFDLEGTVTSGIISAKERPITAGGETGDASDVSYVDALQTDAPINPGNSGGPLLDSRARVIGINSAIRSADDGAETDGTQAGSIGLGFAIPVNQGKRVAEELINTGRATHPVIGVTLDMDYSGDGARINTKGHDGGPAVTTGGPGARAGLEAGDVITEVDGQRVHSGEELIVKTRAHRPGDRLRLTVERDGKERTVSLELGSAGS
ncbi:trypsin-like peptidase domain-containing protein [Streptomyces sp. NPDC048751]|uniref:trypsin-like peptidase domain-containing protein n=1 Tax=Streptomyces sp. NPDC048751 TaxID=3365591 RepID=UPI003715F76F